MPEDTDNEGNKVQLSIRLPDALKRDFESIVKKNGSDNTAVLGRLIRSYVAGDPSTARIASGDTAPEREVDSEFVKCPLTIRPVILTAIARLLEMDPKDLPAMEHLIVRFSQPGYIETLLADNARATLKTGPQPVPPKAKGNRG